MSDFLGHAGAFFIVISAIYLAARAIVWLASAGPVGIAVLGLCFGIILVALAMRLD